MDKAEARTTPWRIRIIRVVFVTVLILSVPFVGMQFSNEVDWSGSDFIIMGLLLITAGLLFELILTKVRDTSRRVVFSFLLLAGLLYVWAELAVGIFTNLGS